MKDGSKDKAHWCWRDDLACIALATGDSDFSPLFRRLREMGKQVVGIGPRSALSESVKSSCSRFSYTKTETASAVQDEASRASAFDEKALGFKRFTAFVKAVDGIELVQDDKTWSAFFQETEASPGPLPKKPKKAAPRPQEMDLTETYRIILRKKHWRSIPASVLARCYSKM